jgi:hypothetical protein
VLVDSHPPDVGRKRSAEAIDDVEGNAGAFFDQALILCANRGLMQKAVRSTFIAHDESVSPGKIKPQDGARSMMERSVLVEHVRTSTRLETR